MTPTHQTQPEQPGTTPPPAAPATTRTEFEQRVRHALSRSARAQPACLVHLDVCGAWDVRDAGGEAALEALEAAVGRAVGDALGTRAACCFGRDAGITALLEDTAAHAAAPTARQLKHAIDRLRFEWHEHPFRLEACAGVVELGPVPDDFDTWVARAREACDAARELAGDGVQVVINDEHAWSDVRHGRDWVRHLSEILG